MYLTHPTAADVSFAMAEDILTLKIPEQATAHQSKESAIEVPKGISLELGNTSGDRAEEVEIRS